MSTETILSRMMSEPAFADAVFADATQALAEYNLSAEDLAKFNGLTRAHFTAMTTEDRKSFAAPPERNPGWVQHNETALVIR